MPISCCCHLINQRAINLALFRDYVIYIFFFFFFVFVCNFTSALFIINSGDLVRHTDNLHVFCQITHSLSLFMYGRMFCVNDIFSHSWRDLRSNSRSCQTMPPPTCLVIVSDLNFFFIFVVLIVSFFFFLIFFLFFIVSVKDV